MTSSDNIESTVIPQPAQVTPEPVFWTSDVEEMNVSPYPFMMSRILTEERSGRFAIEKTITPAGTVVDSYDSHRGKIKNVRINFDYPVVKLTEDGNTWMSDNLFEVESNMGPVEIARGDVLVSGLGIGLLPTLIKDKVNGIDIVELSQDVIDLVFHQIATDKMKIIRGEICQYLATTEKQYDLICIDIWQNTFLPLWDIDGIKKLAERCLKPGGTTWCWLEEMYRQSQKIE